MSFGRLQSTLGCSREHADNGQGGLVSLPGPKSAPVGPPHLRKLNAPLASPMNQPPPSGGEFGGLTAIYLRLALAGLRQVEESFELCELF
jgi:hypothetical protein